ncbi:nucleotidyltransferase family protein [Nocardioides sp. GXQ0305]|uniref:nucleotidyltransferase family protein n=1 Tax=Nocardioides sp. GXQ0305 TaxID=3423912 RepID=UPI003D7EE2B8
MSPAPQLGPLHDTLTRAVAAHGLPGSTLDLPARPLPTEEFDALVRSVQSQRLTGLMWAAVEAGALPVTAEQRRRTEWLHVEVLAGVLALERLLLETVDALEGAGVSPRVLKGPVLAHVDYPEPAWRTFGDIDLLVRSDDFERAAVVLEQRGHRRRYPEPRPGFDSRYSKGTSFVTSDGLELDLHRSFTMGPLGVRLAVDELWCSSQSFRMAGHRLEALGVEERFVHACYHAALGDASPRLVPLRDVAQLALTYPLDGERIHRLARASGGEAVVAQAVRHAWSLLRIADVLAISAWAQSYRPDSHEVADLAVYERGSSYARKSVAAIRALPLRERASYVYALASPTRSYIGDRHAGRMARLRAGLRQSRLGAGGR